MSDKPPQHRPHWLAALLLAVPAGAGAGSGMDDVQIHGFASQGWVISAGNNVYGRSDDNTGSGEFRELGVNASWRPHGTLLFAAQMAAVEQGQSIDEDMLLEYGLADWTPWSGKAGRFGLRAGKLKVPIGFYNDSRDAVFTRPGITLPESVYLDNSGARAFGYFSAEGGGLYGDWYAGEHALYAEFVYAAPQELDDSAEIAILRNTVNGTFELDRGLVLRLADDYDGGRYRAAISILTTELAYEPGAGAFIFNQGGDFQFDQAVLSLQANTGEWSFTSEITARHIELQDLSTFGFIDEIKQDPFGWYLQSAWRFAPKWQALLRYDEQIRDIQDRHGYEQAAAPVVGLPRHYYFARDWTTGLRHDVRSNVSVWAEYHYVDGAGWVNPIDNPAYNTGAADRYWNLFAVMIGLRF